MRHRCTAYNKQNVCSPQYIYLQSGAFVDGKKWAQQHIMCNEVLLHSTDKYCLSWGGRKRQPFPEWLAMSTMSPCMLHSAPQVATYMDGKSCLCANRRCNVHRIKESTQIGLPGYEGSAAFLIHSSACWCISRSVYGETVRFVQPISHLCVFCVLRFFLALIYSCQ